MTGPIQKLPATIVLGTLVAVFLAIGLLAQVEIPGLGRFPANQRNPALSFRNPRCIC